MGLFYTDAHVCLIQGVRLIWGMLNTGFTVVQQLIISLDINTTTTSTREKCGSIAITSYFRVTYTTEVKKGLSK